MFNFTDTKALSEQGAWVHLKDNGRPAYWTGEDGKVDKSRPVRVKVFGPDSPTLKDRARARAAKMLKERGANAEFKKMSVGEIEALIEDGEQTRAENCADQTMDWENMPGPDGQPLPFSREAALTVYQAYPQIVDDAGDIKDFLALNSAA